MNKIILDTHYGVVRYLYYEVFLKKHNQINDLQKQILYLSCINKYLLCRTDQYSQLYDMYTNLSDTEIKDYYEHNRITIFSSPNEWINFTSLINAPRVLPHNIDGPYKLDNLTLRRYTYFWMENYAIQSNILATPFYCLYGIDHLHYEMIKWKSQCENLGIDIRVRSKHIFHDIFYLVDFKGITEQTQNVRIRFLIWLDDPDIGTELYVADNGVPINLLQRLYIACDNRMFIIQMSDPNINDIHTRILNRFMNSLSENFVVTFDGQPPIVTRRAVLNVTNGSSLCTQQHSNMLKFGVISRFGFNPDQTDQIYEIQDLSELNVSQIKTPNFLIFQEEILVSRQPTIAEMNTRLQDLLYLLSLGILNTRTLVRMYMLKRDTAPNSAKKQLTIIYMQKYRKFGMTRERINYDPLFYDKTYVFSAKNLICTVKSQQHLIRDIIKSPPLLPACVMLLNINANENVSWTRITQNIVYLRNIQTLFFLSNLTLQSLNDSPNITTVTAQPATDIKAATIQADNRIRDELHTIFNDRININRLETKTTIVFMDIELKCIVLDPNLKLELYYFAQESNNGKFSDYFKRFMQSTETSLAISERLYTIFMHLLNLYMYDVLI